MRFSRRAGLGLAVAALAAPVAEAQAIGYHFTRDVGRHGATARARGCTSSGKFGVYQFEGRIHYRSSHTNFVTIVRWDEPIMADGRGRRLRFVSVRFTGQDDVPSNVIEAVRTRLRHYIEATRVRYLGPDGGETLHYAGPWIGSNFNLPFHPSPGC